MSNTLSHAIRVGMLTSLSSLGIGIGAVGARGTDDVTSANLMMLIGGSTILGIIAGGCTYVYKTHISHSFKHQNKKI